MEGGFSFLLIALFPFSTSAAAANASVVSNLCDSAVHPQKEALLSVLIFKQFVEALYVLLTSY